MHFFENQPVSKNLDMYHHKQVDASMTSSQGLMVSTIPDTNYNHHIKLKAKAITELGIFTY